MCQGQILPISQNTALFALIGTYYGGNGTTNFALPDLRGRVPLAYGTSNTGQTYDLGQVGGEEQVTLLSSQMPVHTHTFSGTSATGPRGAPADGCTLGASSKPANFYAADSSAQTAINPGTVSPYAGGNLPHSNLQPYVAINWCIALSGIFPSRN
jgi:microcystin-dependent protein